MIVTFFMNCDCDSVTVGSIATFSYKAFECLTKFVANCKGIAIDRETPISTLRKASPEALDAIAGRVRELGIECSVAY